MAVDAFQTAARTHNFPRHTHEFTISYARMFPLTFSGFFSLAHLPMPLTGPAFWGLINPEWSLCNKGRRQSPVNLEPQRLLYDPNLRPLHIDKHRVSERWPRHSFLIPLRPHIRWANRKSNWASIFCAFGVSAVWYAQHIQQHTKSLLCLMRWWKCRVDTDPMQSSASENAI